MPGWSGAALLLGLLGCGERGGQAPARAYAEASALAVSDPVAAAARCDLAAPAVRAECRVLTAHAVAQADPAAAAAICQGTEPGPWQDECGFLVAEARAAKEGSAAAIGACDAAGRFVDHCLDHLWRAHATALLRAGGPGEAATTYAAARAWADGRLNGAKQELDGRFWMAFYDAPLHDDGLPPLDETWCAQMEGDVAAACAAWLAPTLWKTLVRLERERQAQGQGFDRGRLCGGGAAGAAAQAAFGLRWVDGPALDAVAQRFVGARCR